MKFHHSAVRLAGIYLAILMAISLFFSMSVYQLSVQELERGLRRPGPGSIINRLPNDGPERLTRGELLQEREEQYQDARNRIVRRLVLVNFLILICGGILSYYFAVRTLKPIEKAHEALERFTADASHELRTPLTAMRTETEVALMDSKLTLTRAKKILGSNIEELEKLTALSEGLLKLARAQNSRLEKTEVSLENIIQKAVDEVMPLAEKKSILLNTTFIPDLTVRAEPASLIEALVILLDNAIKYSPENTETMIDVGEEVRCVSIKITDQGMGIKASEIPYIFERFYRADSARSKHKTGGYGLGLAIAKNIIDLHGGSITAESTPDQGTTFSVILPK
jgi:two-component system, OmpR family, sensor histidine kinase CiaH